MSIKVNETVKSHLKSINLSLLKDVRTNVETWHLFLQCQEISYSHNNCAKQATQAFRERWHSLFDEVTSDYVNGVEDGMW